MSTVIFLAKFLKVDKNNKVIVFSKLLKAEKS